MIYNHGKVVLPPDSHKSCHTMDCIPYGHMMEDQKYLLLIYPFKHFIQHELSIIRTNKRKQV